LQEDGSSVQARFRRGDGLGLRRTALAAALRKRAEECGAELRRGSVVSVQADPGHVEVRTDDGQLQAGLVIAADGLHSPLRRAAGLEKPRLGVSMRYGIRRHFAVSPWTDLVEVHWAPGAEAYVTPIAADCVNVAFLCGGGRFDELIEWFPHLRRRIGSAPALSESRGAGPLLQSVSARHGQRLALLGDAAGYVDAITGQGLSLAFAASALLFEALPSNLSQDLAPALRSYDRQLRLRFRRYAAPAHALLWLSRHPHLRRTALRGVSRVPGMFDTLLQLVA
jgi:flavin-dependent dehydrogenase